MTVLYFAHARRAAGCAEETLFIEEPISPATLWERLIALHPGLAALRSASRFARGNDFLAADAILSPHDEIALIPPVSGG